MQRLTRKEPQAPKWGQLEPQLFLPTPKHRQRHIPLNLNSYPHLTPEIALETATSRLLCSSALPGRLLSISNTCESGYARVNPAKKTIGSSWTSNHLLHLVGITWQL